MNDDDFSGSGRVPRSPESTTITTTKATSYEQSSIIPGLLFTVFLVLVAGILILGVFFIVYVRDGKFTPLVYVNVTVTPSYNVSIPISNTFQPPTTTNTYNMPIYNNVTVVTNQS